MGDWRAHYDRAIRDAQIQQRSDRGEIVRQMKRAERAEKQVRWLKKSLEAIADDAEDFPHATSLALDGLIALDCWDDTEDGDR